MRRSVGGWQPTTPYRFSTEVLHIPEGEVGALSDHRAVVYHFDADAPEMLSGAPRRRARLPEPCPEDFVFRSRPKHVSTSFCNKGLMLPGPLRLTGLKGSCLKRPGRIKFPAVGSGIPGALGAAVTMIVTLISRPVSGLFAACCASFSFVCVALGMCLCTGPVRLLVPKLVPWCLSCLGFSVVVPLPCSRSRVWWQSFKGHASSPRLGSARHRSTGLRQPSPNGSVRRGVGASLTPPTRNPPLGSATTPEMSLVYLPSGFTKSKCLSAKYCIGMGEPMGHYYPGATTGPQSAPAA